MFIEQRKDKLDVLNIYGNATAYLHVGVVTDGETFAAAPTKMVHVKIFFSGHFY